MEQRRKILVVNDDGIHSPLLALLARHAAKYGLVDIVAPASQCSAMSQRIIIDRALQVETIEPAQLGLSDIPDIRSARSLAGTPADCVRYACGCLLDEVPDIVFSGINDGYNAGVDILYSGTVGAAMQALVAGVPAIAFSLGRGAKDASVPEQYLDEVIEELLSTPVGSDQIWNVNFPNCVPELVKGILRDRIPDAGEFTANVGYDLRQTEKGQEIFSYGISLGGALPGSDKEALMDHYLSIGKLRCMVM